MRLTQDFFRQDALTAAQSLLGKRLVRHAEDGTCTAGIIVETEAYPGRIDPAAHAYIGKTARTKVLFESPKARAYIYLIYGMYHCLNITTGTDDEPDCVLIRAIEPTDGIEIMQARRGTDKLRNLCSGPGKLCLALDVTRDLYGTDMANGNALYLEEGIAVSDVNTSKRIGLNPAWEGADFLWRFTVAGNKFISG